MNTAKPSTRAMVVRVVLFFCLAGLLVNGATYGLLRATLKHAGPLAKVQPPLAEAGALIDWVHAMGRMFWPFFVPASVVLFGVLALLTVLSLRRIVVPQTTPKSAKTPAQPTGDAKAQAERQMIETRQRLYLHLIAVLQKEGRLLDFFSEDLGQYDDGQIGAAVRNIHANCGKALQKHLLPQAVLKQNEDEEITVEENFDPNLIKLVGNVTGRPPFKGVVRHRGWRARKLELPAFSGSQAPEIIFPAEVEVK
jgi:hypothetical protein